MILGALDQAGGQQYLAEQARANPAAFMTLLGKVLPHQVGGVPREPIAVDLTIEERGQLLAARSTRSAHRDNARPFPTTRKYPAVLSA